jgi:hypothetical protein
MEGWGRRGSDKWVERIFFFVIVETMGCTQGRAWRERTWLEGRRLVSNEWGGDGEV